MDRQIPAVAAFAALCSIEAVVAAYGTTTALSQMPPLRAAIEFMQHAVPVAQRFSTCDGSDGTTGALIAVSAIFLPLKALALFIAFPFTLRDTERLWAGYREAAPGVIRLLFIYMRRTLLLGLCAVPALFVFVGFADDIDTGHALRVTLTRYKQFCEGGLTAYPHWLMYTMFATVPCLIYFAAVKSLLSTVVSVLTINGSSVKI